MLWVLLVLGTLAVVECLIRCPLLKIVRRLLGVVHKSLHVIAAKNISDHWKEKVVPAYAQKLLIYSIQLFCWMLIAFSPLLFAGLLGVWLPLDLFAYLASWEGMLSTTILAMLYLAVRNFLIKPKTK